MAHEDNVYNRFDPDDDYDRHVFRHYGLQSAELNEIQSAIYNRIQGVGDSFYSDGRVIDGDDPLISDTTLSLFDSQVYLRGSVRNVPAEDLEVTLEGEEIVGVYLQEETITELEDPNLRNPAVGTVLYDEPGAARVKVSCVWGKQADGTLGEFYPVYTIEDGEILQNDPPPQLDTFTQLLARYDRNSNGHYILNGLRLQFISEDSLNQVFSVSEGDAHVWGFEVSKHSATRLNIPVEPDLAEVIAEPHVFDDSGDGTDTITLNQSPIAGISQIRVTTETTSTITRGPATGGTDPLPDDSISSLLSVSQGSTTYVAGSDYVFTGSEIDWSPGGDEPAPGSTYEATYNHVVLVDPIETTDSTVTIDTAIDGTTVFFDYTWKMPRIDRVALDQTGQLQFIKGVSTRYNPKPASVPRKLLALAWIHQNWTSTPTVRNDGVRVTPMDELEHMQSQIDDLYVLVSSERLKSDIAQSDPTTKKGVFVDGFFDDDLRDPGRAQSASVVGQELHLTIDATIHDASGNMGRVEMLPYTTTVVLEQEKETGQKRINPYQAFEPLPLKVELEPPVDHFTEVNESISTVTRRFETWEEDLVGTSEEINIISESSRDAEFLRERDVTVIVTELGQNELVNTITFDGLDLTPSGPLEADEGGRLETSITIPEGIPSGAKEVVVQSAGGLSGAATYVGRGEIVDRELRRVITTGVLRQPVDPLAQTFTLPDPHSIAGVEFHFEEIGSEAAKHDVYAQLRTVSLGVPTDEVIAEGVLQYDDIELHPSYVRVEWSPVVLDTDQTYAIVLLTDDPDHAVAIAELGKFDEFQQTWVTGQPYPIGVLLSSSNAQTWTPHQSSDLKFRLLAANYLSTNTTVSLATVPVEDVTDISILAGVERPTSDCDVEFHLEMEDGSTIEVVEFQGVRLDEEYTGDIEVQAVLAGTSEFSPTLYDGVQLVTGTIHNSDDYITRAIPCVGETTLTVHLDQILPQGSGVAVDYEIDDSGTWTTVPFVEAEPLGDGWNDVKYQVTGIQPADFARVRITLTGDTASRPRCANLRCFAT